MIINYVFKTIFCIFTGLITFYPSALYASLNSTLEVKTAQSVDLQKYMGTWYEVASIPQFFQRKCLKNTQANYNLVDGEVSVLNSCIDKNGEIKKANGRAKSTNSTTNSQLKVTFVKLWDWIYMLGGNYWILSIDKDYQTALIGDPSRSYAWILSRTPSISMEKYIESETTYREQGYDTCLILTSIQDGGIQSRIPLCEHIKMKQ